MCITKLVRASLLNYEGLATSVTVPTLISYSLPLTPYLNPQLLPTTYYRLPTTDYPQFLLINPYCLPSSVPIGIVFIGLYNIILLFVVIPLKSLPIIL